jgi:hypothetical protein
LTTAGVGEKPRETFSGRVVLVMLAVGVAAFAGLLALSAYAPDLHDGLDGQGHALSRSAIGFAGIVRLLRDAGEPAVAARGPVPLNGAQGILVVTPPPGATAKDLTKLKPNRRVLIVLPKWRTTPAPGHLGWVQKAGLLAPNVVASVLVGRDLGSFTVTWRNGASKPILANGPFAGATPSPLGTIDHFQTLDLPNAKVMLADDAGRGVLVKLDDKTMVLSDPDILNNQGLANLATTEAAVAILDACRGGQGPVIFDVTMNGFKRSRSLLRLALEPPFLGATLCALAAALLMGAHAAVRFGAPTPGAAAMALGKAALVENAAVLIELAKREPAMASRYADVVRRGAAKGMGLPTATTADRIDRALDAATHSTEAPFSTLAAEARTVKTRADLLNLARRLHRRRLEITREQS